MTTTIDISATSDDTVSLWDGKLDIRVRMAGAGAPILYLHPAAGLQWDPFLTHLADSFTVYAPEFPGTTPGNPYAIHGVDHLSDMVLVYEELVRTLGLDRPIVIGQSFGGMLAAELTATFPSLASRVVLLDPIGLWREDLPIPNWMVTPPEQLPALLFHDPANPAAQAMFTLPDDLDTQATIIAGMTWAMGCTGKFVWPIPDRGLSRRLHRLSVPVLLIWGRQDRLTPVGYVPAWEAALADCHSVIIDDCGHIPQLEKLAETLAAVEQFLLGTRRDRTLTGLVH